VDEKKLADKLGCPQSTGNCQDDIKEILKRLGTGAETFVQLNGKIELCQRELELIWEWKRNQNGDIKLIKDTLHSLDKDGIKNLAAQSEKFNVAMVEQMEKQKKEIEALVKPVCDTVKSLQSADDAKKAVGMFKNKTAENALKYMGGGAAIILSLWKIWEIISAALEGAKGL
jgi:chromosome segregation ATPase